MIPMDRKAQHLGAGVGAGIYSSFEEAFKGLTRLHEESPNKELSTNMKRRISNGNKY